MSLTMHRVARISLAALLLAAARPAVADAADGRAALDLVPDWAGTIVVLNADHMRRSSLFGDLIGLVEKSSATRADARLLREAGFDLERDLRTVVLASQPDDPKNVLLLVQARMDAGLLLGKAVKNGGVRRTHRAQTYVEVSRGKLSIAEIGGYLVIAPSPRHMRSVIDVQRGKGRSVRDNRRLMSLVRRTDADGDLWMVLGLAPRKGESSNAGLADLKTVTASLDVASGLHMQMHLYARSDQGATEVASYLAQLAEQSADHPDLAALFGTLTVKRTGSRVAASMKLSASELTSLTRKLLAAR